MPETVSTANATAIVPQTMRAAAPPQNLLLQLLFTSFSFDLDCASARYLEPPPRNSSFARRMESRCRRKTATVGPYLRYRRWKRKDDNREERLEQVVRLLRLGS